MKQVANVLLFIVVFVFSSQCKSNSIREGDLYRESEGLFVVRSPVSSMGGKFAETKGSVQFYDDLGQLYKIDYGLLPPALLEEFAQYSKADQQKEFGRRFIVPYIQRKIPDASVVHEEMITNDDSYFMVMNFPKGSTYTVNGERQDILRGLLLFSHADRMYVLHIQLPFSAGFLNNPTTADITQSLKTKLIEFHKNIRFL